MKTILLILLLALSSAQALTVTSGEDIGPGTLREALSLINDGDTIDFAVSAVTITSEELVIDRSISLHGPVTIARAGAARFRIFLIKSGEIVMMDGVTIQGGYADASVGGGIFNRGGLALRFCSVVNNFSDAGDGGGGIYNSGLMAIVDSTVSGNRAGFTTGLPVGYGGGIRSSGNLEITNSTISGNVADLSGGGVYCTGTVLIRNSTLAGNEATDAGGGIFVLSGSLEIENAVLAGWQTIAASVGSTVTSNGFNLSSDNGGGFLNKAGDRSGVDPLLGSLADNGGPTFTHRLLEGSPAINSGRPLSVPPMPEDQRGFARVFGGRVDIGSVEEQPTPSPAPTPTATAQPTASPATPTIPPTATPSAAPVLTPTPTPTLSPTPTVAPTQHSSLLNISTRGIVQAGDGAMIAGFILGSQGRVAIRGLGPSIPVPGVLGDPVLELRDSEGALIVANDNWQDDPVTASDLVFRHLAPQDSLEAGICIVLPVGAYTAALRGKNDGVGIGLVEIYGLP